ncbi:MAG: hypothetical protein GX074_05155 [Erysipelothrix sp.]|nr:hypothetical protein [Erysipelothrix sp.]
MNRGYILVLSLITLLMSSIFLSLAIANTKEEMEFVAESKLLSERYEAERWIIAEALFYASFELDDEISETYGDYVYLIEIEANAIKILVSGKEEYAISLRYDSECTCFKDILYE